MGVFSPSQTLGLSGFSAANQQAHEASRYQQSGGSRTSTPPPAGTLGKSRRSFRRMCHAVVIRGSRFARELAVGVS